MKNSEIEKDDYIVDPIDGEVRKVIHTLEIDGVETLKLKDGGYIKTAEVKEVLLESEVEHLK